MLIDLACPRYLILHPVCLCPPSSTVQEVPESISTSLEEDGVAVTRTTSVANLEGSLRGWQEDIWQTDRLSQSYSARTPSPPKPLPPHTIRPHSVADFRHRRFKRHSSAPHTTQYVISYQEWHLGRTVVHITVLPSKP